MNEEQKLEQSHLSWANILSTGDFIVEFKKVDGSLRKMHCTRDPNLIPDDNNELVLKEGAVPKNPNYTALRVYEIGVGWRSFKIDSVVSLTNVELQRFVDEAQIQ